MAFVDTTDYGSLVIKSIQQESSQYWNPTGSDANLSRPTDIQFFGTQSDTSTGQLALIRAAHSGTGADNNGILRAWAQTGASGTIDPLTLTAIWEGTNSSFAVNKPTSINNNLLVTGTSNFTGLLTADDVIATGNVEVSGDLSVSGTLLLTNLDVPGTLSANIVNVTGATTLRNTLSVSGATSINNTLLVTGATTLRSTLAVSGTATFNGVLNVTGTAGQYQLASSVFVDGVGSAVTGAITPGVNLFVDRASGLNGALYFGPPSTLNTWRMIRSGTRMFVQRFDGTVYQTRQNWN